MNMELWKGNTLKDAAVLSMFSTLPCIFCGGSAFASAPATGSGSRA